MFATLYALSFITLAISIVLWFFFQKNILGKKIPQYLFAFSLVAYLISFVFVEDVLNHKLLWLLPRELLGLLVTTFLSKKMSSAGINHLYLVVGIILGSYFSYFDTLKSSFASSSSVHHSGVSADGEILFDIKNPAELAELTKMLSVYEVKVKKAFPEVIDTDITELDDYYVLDVPTKYEDKLDEILLLLHKSGKTDDEELNEVLSLDPNELKTQKRAKLLSTSNYAINDPHLDKLWAFDQMNFKEFYSYVNTTELVPQKKARIAILDTGVDANHEDIKDNFFSINSQYDIDKQSHGTHCAGIAAATSNNQLGIASFATAGNFVEVTSVKVLDDNGMGTEQTIINGIIEAADNKVDVISMSLGGPKRAEKQRAYDVAIKYANDKGVIVVVAAGNEGQNAKKVVPASCKGVITVSAVDNQLKKASFSNWVTDISYGIAAPGVDIYSTIPNNQYKSNSGTSMATPYVAGIVGIMKAINPLLTTQDVYEILHSTGIETQNTKETGRFIQPYEVLKKFNNP